LLGRSRPRYYIACSLLQKRFCFFLFWMLF